jgi:hypothetical protein
VFLCPARLPGKILPDREGGAEIFTGTRKGAGLAGQKGAELPLHSETGRRDFYKKNHSVKTLFDSMIFELEPDISTVVFCLLKQGCSRQAVLLTVCRPDSVCPQ